MIANRLVEAGMCVVLTGIPPEVEIIQGVLSGSDAPLQDVCGQLSIGGLAGLLSRAALVIANDSGPLHLAEAVGTPTVGIYWCGNLITAGSLTRSSHRTVLSWQLECSVCGHNTIYDPCLHRESFVAGIPAEDVLAEAFDLLSQSPVSKPS
jgi:ADP-heptose:LPS heptosyltransferase